MKSKSKAKIRNKEYLIKHNLPAYFITTKEGLELIHQLLECITPVESEGYGSNTVYTYVSKVNKYGVEPLVAIENAGSITDAICMSCIADVPFDQALEIVTKQQFNERCRGIKAYESVQHANDETTTEHTEVA